MSHANGIRKHVPSLAGLELPLTQAESTYFILPTSSEFTN